ncbi:uncharacterized protein LOC114579784 [Dendrobium catenatum]|uniref:uncharacterized protein LOC114579784 n=1 Tax=Dendrobium catenatum TaxID=906689 RepID=UPI00109F5C1A|nr:uncharacterized protein LOC114579784 [Dendrobium catenatum]
MVEFMVENDLHDLGFLGPKYTWSNNKFGHSKIWVRLDRILMNSEGLRWAPVAVVKHLVRLTSDHCPLLVNLFAETPRPGNIWIRFKDIWMTYPVTWRLVWKNWTMEDFGMPDEVVNRKCSRTLKALFFWSHNRLKELSELKLSLESHIEELQLVDCSPNELNEEQEQELRLKAIELNTTLARLATWWKQREKARWIDEGDTNLHFFHSFASGRMRGNRIIEVIDSNGERIVDPNLIQEEFWNFFMLKWRDRQVSLANWPEFCNDDMIPVKFSESMEAEISESEIRQAVFSMGSNRAPGIDGITSSFFKF